MKLGWITSAQDISLRLREGSRVLMSSLVGLESLFILKTGDNEKQALPYAEITNP
jgi:hypothetical protein